MRNEKYFSNKTVEVIEEAVKSILTAINGDVESDGLKETPTRVAKMYLEVFEGMQYTNKEIAEMFSKCFEHTATNDLVVIGNLDIFSFCEHHLALMYNMKVHVGYIPNGSVIGLSKVARIADMVSKRLQLQERIGSDIADVLQMAIGVDDVIVVIEGEHSCMTARGVKKPGARTKTATLRGKFETNTDLRQEFYNLI